jgi:hypothetical protein
VLRIRPTARGRAGRKPSADAATVIAGLLAGESPKALAKRLSVSPAAIYRARDRALRGGVIAPAAPTLP